MDEVDDKDIEDFTYGLISSVIDLSKKHSDPNFQLHLPIGMIESIRMLNRVRKKRAEKKTK